jgi:hypothetical protein
MLRRVGPSEETIAAFQAKIDEWRTLERTLRGLRKVYALKLRQLEQTGERLAGELETQAGDDPLLVLLLATRRPDLQG